MFARRVPTPRAAKRAKTLRERRFLAQFHELWKRFRERHSRQSEKLGRNPTICPATQNRKRTALVLGLSALSLAGASPIALMAETLQEDQTRAEAAIAETPDPMVRRDASLLDVSDTLIDAMVEEEGVRYRVYRDVAGYPTVGVGHLVLPEDNLRLGQRITHERAMELLRQDLAKAQDGVRELVGYLPINQHEFDALVDLVFNVGIGNVGPDESPRLNAAIEAGDYEAIAAELEYTTAAGRVARGLIYRSERRTQIFLDADYSDPRAA